MASSYYHKEGFDQALHFNDKVLIYNNRQSAAAAASDDD